MANRSFFVLDDDFAENLAHTRGTLNPVGDVVRRRTDIIRNRARRAALKEAAAARANQRQAGAKDERYGKTGGRTIYAAAKAEAWSLEAYAESIYGEMRGVEHGEDSTTGRVVAAYPGAEAIEFGGYDPAVVQGNTDTHVIHPPRAILRRAVDGGPS